MHWMICNSTCLSWPCRQMDMEVCLFHGPKMAEPRKRLALRVKTSGPLGTIYLLQSYYIIIIYTLCMRHMLFYYNIYIYIGKICGKLSKSFLRSVTSNQMVFQSGPHLCSKLHALTVMCIHSISRGLGFFCCTQWPKFEFGIGIPKKCNIKNLSAHIHQEVPFLLLFQGGHLPRWHLLGPHRHELARQPASLLLRPVAGATRVKRDYM